MASGSEALLSQVLVQTHCQHDMNLRLELSTVIFLKIKSQNLNLSLPSNFKGPLTDSCPRLHALLRR